ncbi:MAG TPA: DNA-formamidopyrimidine glycosylase family protein [Cytophagaceae bacterium]|jgi:endonuclease-8|nr:DNA-formamidopyrimidine glycosylase family protein [Cytophagaceae bacterium]
MPEGPSIVILKEQAKPFEGKKILSVTGNSKIDQKRLDGKKIKALKSWGKHFLICFDDFIVRIHFLMFGSYLINERKEQAVRLSLKFQNGELNFYNCSIKFLEGTVDDHYDFSIDVMNDKWDPRKANKKLKQTPNKMVCDALLEQDIYAGVGNIIKNEVLYRVRVHPESKVGKVPIAKLRKMTKEARSYSFEFLEWKKNFVLRKHWLVHTKTVCHRCNLPIVKKYTGVKKRRSFFCNNCQLLYK